jgi:hypothetical protein
LKEWGGREEKIKNKKNQTPVGSPIWRQVSNKELKKWGGVKKEKKKKKRKRKHGLPFFHRWHEQGVSDVPSPPPPPPARTHTHTHAHTHTHTHTHALRGVPFFIVNKEEGVSGAQPPETFVEIFNGLLKA